MEDAAFTSCWEKLTRPASGKGNLVRTISNAHILLLVTPFVGTYPAGTLRQIHHQAGSGLVTVVLQTGKD